MKRPRTEWNERSSVAVNARRQLPRMMSEYFVEVRAALADKYSPAALHWVRLASKKVRYTLELFRRCYGAAGFDARLKALKDVQTSLGDVNDAVAARRLLAKVMPHSPRRQALREFLKQRAAEKAEEFRAHWTETFDAAGQERWWTDFLGGRHGAKDGSGVHGDRAGRRPSRRAGA
jgi:CHAD domain-containing protein